MDPQGSIFLAINIAMIKVGVFGDSFASHGDPDCTWASVLSKLDDKITVTNHGYMGSSLWFTYQQLREHAHKYTHIVVMVTQWGRYKLPGLTSPSCHVPGIGTLEDRLRGELAPQDKTSFESLLNWMIHCRDDEQEKLYHQLLVTHIYSTFHKTANFLMVPCFNPDHSGIIPGWTGPCMMDISFKDTTIPGWSDSVLADDPRPCHMNRANNERFAHMVLGWVHGAKFKIKLNDYVEGQPWEIGIKT